MASRLAAEILTTNMGRRGRGRRRLIQAKTTKGPGQMIAYIGKPGNASGSTLAGGTEGSGGSTLHNG